MTGERGMMVAIRPWLEWQQCLNGNKIEQHSRIPLGMGINIAQKIPVQTGLNGFQ
jgi:hypothetical protein